MFNEQEIKARIIAKCEGRSYMLQELIIEMQARGRKTITLAELAHKLIEEEERVKKAREDWQRGNK